MADKFEASTNAVKEAQDQELLDFTARRLMEMAADIIMSHLLIQDASRSSELFSKSAHVYLNYAEAEVENMLTLSATSIKKTWLSIRSNRILYNARGWICLPEYDNLYVFGRTNPALSV